MNKKEIHDEMLRVKTELVLNKRNNSKAEELKVEYEKLRNDLKKVLFEEAMQPKEEKEQSEKER